MQFLALPQYAKPQYINYIMPVRVQQKRDYNKSNHSLKPHLFYQIPEAFLVFLLLPQGLAEVPSPVTALHSRELRIYCTL